MNIYWLAQLFPKGTTWMSQGGLLLSLLNVHWDMVHSSCHGEDQLYVLTVDPEECGQQFNRHNLFCSMCPHSNIMHCWGCLQIRKSSPYDLTVSNLTCWWYWRVGGADPFFRTLLHPTSCAIIQGFTRS